MYKKGGFRDLTLGDSEGTYIGSGQVTFYKLPEKHDHVYLVYLYSVFHKMSFKL